jgi:hypothetical protein
MLDKVMKCTQMDQTPLDQTQLYFFILIQSKQMQLTPIKNSTINDLEKLK